MKRRLVSVVLWIVAFILAVVLGVFQRLTGPTHPLRGTIELGGQSLAVRLLRSHGGAGDLPVRLAASEGVSGAVEWRRYPTDDPWQRVELAREGSELVAAIPHQPPAGKVEYRLLLWQGAATVDFPADEPVVARFRGDVPASVLIPHILAMFVSMLLATRALLELVRGAECNPWRTVLAAMALLMLGGLLLGPMVQKHAFDAYWTGWPFGSDLTDNKTLIAFLAWLPASILALRKRTSRWLLAAGWLVMMGVFLIPHSLRGSEINWSEHPPTPPVSSSAGAATEP